MIKEWLINDKEGSKCVEQNKQKMSKHLKLKTITKLTQNIHHNLTDNLKDFDEAHIHKYYTRIIIIEIRTLWFLIRHHKSDKNYNENYIFAVIRIWIFP